MSILLVIHGVLSLTDAATTHHLKKIGYVGYCNVHVQTQSGPRFVRVPLHDNTHVLDAIATVAHDVPRLSVCERITLIRLGDAGDGTMKILPVEWADLEHPHPRTNHPLRHGDWLLLSVAQ